MNIGRHQSPFVTQQSPAHSTHSATGSLSNLRLAVKDLFDVEGLLTGAGNPDWQNQHPVATETASSVKKLLDHGAQWVGKTITDELAYSLNGNNIHFPPLHNVLDEQRICGGSSSGSAVAVGEHFADIGLGTDTGGSIRVPASYNGLFGLRHTHGVIATDGLVSLAPSFDTVGWMTRDIKTLEQVAQVLLPQEQLLRSFEMPRFCLMESAVEQCEFAQLVTDWLKQTPQLSDYAFADINFETLQIASNAFRVLQGREIWQTHGQWIQQRSPTFAKDIKSRLDWCSTLTKADELAAVDQQQHFIRLLKTVLDEKGFIIMPTTPGAAPLRDCDEQVLAQYRNRLLSFTCVAGLAGLPQLHIPLFIDGNQAFGISIIGQKNRDWDLIQIAKTFLEKT
jgi:Asp-tRNA(Asn)/Glu-tRNA(Gln) amidotransferase A subunit family amidase